MYYFKKNMRDIWTKNNIFVISPYGVIEFKHFITVFPEVWKSVVTRTTLAVFLAFVLLSVFILIR